MILRMGDNVTIEGCAEESIYKGQIFTLIYDPYKILGQQVAKIRCLKTNKYHGTWPTKFLKKVVN